MKLRILPFLGVLSLGLTSAAHADTPATGVGFHCKATDRHGVVTDELSLTPTTKSALEVLSTNEFAFLLSGRISSLTKLGASATKVFQDDAGQPMPANEAYEILPTRLICLTSPANPYLARCTPGDGGEATANLKGVKSGLEYHLSGFRPWGIALWVDEEIKSVINPDVERTTTRTFRLKFNLALVQGALDTIDRVEEFDGTTCSLLR